MLKRKLFKNVGFSLLLCSASIYSGLTHAAFASFDANATVTASSDLDFGDFATYFVDSGVFTDGDATGTATGSLDAFGGPTFDVLAAGETRSVTASATGETTGQGFAESFFVNVGELYFDNFGFGAVTGATATFDIELTADIFTNSSFSDYATAYVSVEIINSFFDTVAFEEINLDSFLHGVGSVSGSVLKTVDVAFDIAADEFEVFSIILNVEGYAETIPEPSGIMLAGLALLFAVRRRKMY